MAVGQPDAEVAMFDEGRAAMERGDFTLAVTKLQEVVRGAPSPAALQLLGVCLLRASRPIEAITYLAAAVGLGASGASSRARLASALLEADDRAEAFRQLRLALQEEPDSAEARESLKRALADPHAIAKAANRHRLIEELRTAVPHFRVRPDRPPADVFRALGHHIVLRVEYGAPDDHLAPAFAFLNRLAVSPDSEVVNLLQGGVFPAVLESEAACAKARRLLVGKGREAFEYALALRGPATEPDAGIAMAGLGRAIKLAVPELNIAPDDSWDDIGTSLGRFLADQIAGSDAEGFDLLDLIEDLADGFRVLNRMAESSDNDVLVILRCAFDAMGKQASGDVATKLLSSRASKFRDWRP